MALTVTFQCNCQKKSEKKKKNQNKKSEQQTELWHSASPFLPGSFFTASHSTLSHNSLNPKAPDPAWSFIPHRLFAARLTSGAAKRDPQVVFDLVQRMCAQEKLPHHSSWGQQPQAPALEEQELLAFNREARSRRLLLIKQGVISERESIVEDFLASGIDQVTYALRKYVLTTTKTIKQILVEGGKCQHFLESCI